MRLHSICGSRDIHILRFDDVTNGASDYASGLENSVISIILARGFQKKSKTSKNMDPNGSQTQKVLMTSMQWFHF